MIITKIVFLNCSKIIISEDRVMKINAESEIITLYIITNERFLLYICIEAWHCGLNYSKQKVNCYTLG